MTGHIVELDADHPGFSDLDYRRRRDEIALMAPPLNSGDPPEIVEYSSTEGDTWATVFDKLTALYPTHACREFVAVIDDIGYRRDAVPQLCRCQSLPHRQHRFLAPAGGRVGLGARVSRRPLATRLLRDPVHPPPLRTALHPRTRHRSRAHGPRADARHPRVRRPVAEDRRGSLEADDAQVDQLATLYWFTIEYGVLLQDGVRKAYGAGLLSSFGELEHALSGKVEIRPFDPWIAKDTPYPITTYQPLLWSVNSIREAFDRMTEFVGE